MNLLISSFQKLKNYCEAEQFKGWDPYDGLNSKLLRTLLPLRKSAILRLVIIQGFKRSPFNLRKLALVPKQHNAKGIGLFLQGYCNLVKAVEKDPTLIAELGSKESLLGKVRELADLLISLRSKGDYHGACWGYNFDWQARRLFLFPAYTPTVVATSFCATALLDAYELIHEERYKEIALSAAEFVIQDLHRQSYGENSGFLFSYSPLPGNDTVFNASLLGGKLLSFCYKYTGNETYKQLALSSVQAALAGQREDGAWVYGCLPVQGWVDSFHTGYNLDGLIAFTENCLTENDEVVRESVMSAIDKGFNYYVTHMFTDEGTPKYYDNQMYPIDIHCPGQLFVTLHRLHRNKEYQDLAENVLRWTVSNMQDNEGYFYYQLKQGISSKISYMRWSNAFMFNAMSYYILDSVI